MHFGDHGVFGKVAVNDVRRTQLLQQGLIASKDDDVLDFRELCKLYCELAAIGTAADDEQAAWARFIIVPWGW